MPYHGARCTCGCSMVPIEEVGVKIRVECRACGAKRLSLSKWVWQAWNRQKMTKGDRNGGA